jgi:hypothetical protein
MTIHSQHGETTVSTLGRFGPRRSRAVRVAGALGLGAVLVLTGACRRSSGPKADPAVQKWFEQYTAAQDDMSEAARGGSDQKERCQAAFDALESHEPKLVKTPDEGLTQAVQAWVDNRKKAYTDCVATGNLAPDKDAINAIQKRVNELNAQYEGEEG